MYALRSYLYLLLHAAVAGPAALLFGTGAGAASHACSSESSNSLINANLLLPSSLGSHAAVLHCSPGCPM